MLKIKKIINNITKGSKESEYIQNLENKNADYKRILSELELDLLHTTEELEFERESNRKKDTELQKLTEELRVANEKIEELKATIKKLQADKYGTSSEKDKYLKNNLKSKENKKIEQNQKNAEYEKNVNNIKNGKDKDSLKRKKGGQKGHKGYGRKIPKKMKTITYTWELPDNERCCPICGKKYRVIKAFQRKSHEIEIKIELILKHHIEKVYEKNCNCDKNTPELIVAKKPENIIYKSIYTTETWCKLLAMKYLSGIPINRFNELINDNEYKFNSSTVIGGFEKLLEYMKPLYTEILEYNQQESHWHADETRWCKMIDIESSTKRMYWMWVFVGGKSVVYVLDPTRSSKVPEKHFENTKKGILNVDRLASYNIVGDKIILAYCWYHLRRDIIDVGKKYSNLAQWSIDWLLKIRNIEKVNRNRFNEYSQNLNFDKNQIRLEELVDTFFNDAKNELESNSLNNYQIKVLKNMLKKRKGYCTFVDYPWVPLHNNVAERQFRHIAYARNNYSGSKSQWGGEFAAVVWTIFKTAQMNNLNPVEYLKKYFEKYISTNAFKEGIPKELLPWNYKIDIQLDNLNSA